MKPSLLNLGLIVLVLVPALHSVAYWLLPEYSPEFSFGSQQAFAQVSTPDLEMKVKRIQMSVLILRALGDREVADLLSFFIPVSKVLTTDNDEIGGTPRYLSPILVRTRGVSYLIQSGLFLLAVLRISRAVSQKRKNAEFGGSLALGLFFLVCGFVVPLLADWLYQKVV